MKKVISLLLAVLVVMTSAGCEFTDKILNRLETNIGGIADEFTNSGEDVLQPQENSINIGFTDFDTFNPILTSSQTVREAMQFVFDPLFEMNEAMQIVPVLASGYSVSADGLTYNITMKNDVLWHNGKTFDAYDVAYTIKSILMNQTVYQQNLKDMADYRALSDDTLRIVLKKPTPQFVSLLCFPIVQYQSEMAVNPSYRPVGTGAFEFKGKIGIDKYMLSSYGLYHNGQSKIENVYLCQAPDSEKFRTMLEVSETDAATGSSIDLTTYMPKGKSRMNDFVSNKITFLGFNLGSSILKDANTRKGLCELIDKDEIVNRVLYSRGVQTDTAINPYSHLYYDTNTNFGADREKALELFGNDGWGFDEDGNLKKNGQLFRIVMLVDTDDEIKKNIAKSIAEDFEKCGIKIVTDERGHDGYLGAIASHNFDIFVGDYDLGINQDLTPLISSSGNYFGYQSKDADTLLWQSGMVQDEEAIRNIYRQIGEIIRNDAPFAPLYYSKESVLTSGKIKSGVTPSVTGAYRVSNIWSVFE